MDLPFGFKISRGNSGFAGAAPKVNKKGGLEIGDSGTEMLGGIITNEYNTKLRDRSGIAVFDEMRRSDGTVRAAVLATSLPIRRANWYVSPASEEPQDVEIADFVSYALFEYMSITWDDLLRQALLQLPFGVMAFEKVFEVRNVDGKDRIIWKKLAPRLPTSIVKWQMTDGGEGIEQRKQDGTSVNIPMEKLLVFCNEKEGDNWWGTSILRAAYKHWYIKNNFYKIDAIAFERQGLGVPYVKLPEAYTEADRSKAEEILKNLRAHDQAFMIEPHDYEMGFKDMMAHTLRDPQPSIAHHDRAIVKCVLAQFLELGATDSGSRALSEDQSSLFLHSLEAVAHNTADVFNKYAIPQLVDLNFDGITQYPSLEFNGITRADVEKLSRTYNNLINSGGIQQGEGDEVYFRELIGLPERNTDDDAAKKDDDAEPAEDDDEAIEEAGLSEHRLTIKKKVYPERGEVAKCVSASIATLAGREKVNHLKHTLSHIDRIPADNEHRHFFNLVKREVTAALSEARRQLFQEDDEPFKGFRRMTFAEKKVDYKGIQNNLDRMEEEFDTVTQALLHEERDRYMAKVSKAALAGDTQTIKDETFKIKTKYTTIIRDALKKAYEYGKNNASKEMGVTTPVNSKKAMEQIELQADAIAKQHIEEIVNTGTIRYTEAIQKGESTNAALAAMDAAMDELIDELTSDTSSIAMAGGVNNGRATVFETNEEKIYALQRSELLDNRTCNYCLSVDGRVVEKTDPFAKNTIFHSGCRGIWVEILLDEEELPTITGIPKSIRDRFGDTVNDLIQPRSPQTRKDTLARKEVERRARRKAKNG